MLRNVLLVNKTFEAFSSLGVWIHQLHLMLLVNPPIAFNAVSESHNEGTFYGSFVCPMNTKFNHENGCVSEYIFFSSGRTIHFSKKAGI